MASIHTFHYSWVSVLVGHLGTDPLLIPRANVVIAFKCIEKSGGDPVMKQGEAGNFGLQIVGQFSRVPQQPPIPKHTYLLCTYPFPFPF